MYTVSALMLPKKKQQKKYVYRYTPETTTLSNLLIKHRLLLSPISASVGSSSSSLLSLPSSSSLSQSAKSFGLVCHFVPGNTTGSCLTEQKSRKKGSKSNQRLPHYQQRGQHFSQLVDPLQLNNNNNNPQRHYQQQQLHYNSNYPHHRHHHYPSRHQHGKKEKKEKEGERQQQRQQQQKGTIDSF